MLAEGKSRWRTWGLGALGWLVIVAQPVSSTPIRLGIVGGFFALVIGAIALVWSRRGLTVALTLTALTPTAFFILPGRAHDHRELRRAYVQRLSQYEGTSYVWGGENGLGIDCSGLVRRAMVDAHLRQGISTLNGKLSREAASLWWHDASASALGEGYRDDTSAVVSGTTINSLDHTLIAPGDLAVTENGLHVLAYLGDNIWIDADPNAGEVVRVRAPSDSDPWLTQPVRIMRWRHLR